MKKIYQLYAAYKTGVLGEQILDTYFSFIAKILSDDQTTKIEEDNIRKAFWVKYNIELPTTFIRQILSVGVKNGTIISEHGVYSADIDKLKEYHFNTVDFDNKWKNLLNEFYNYSKAIQISLKKESLDNIILSLLDSEVLFDNEIDDCDDHEQPYKYAWYRFVTDCSRNNKEMYDFIAALTTSDTLGEALFFAGESICNLKGLSIYLDTPIVFALLGMDTTERQDSYNQLISDIKKAGADLLIFDHNFGEIRGIISRAIGWAQKTEYSIAKANNVTRFFHDSGMSESEMIEFEVDLENKINELGISIKHTSYDISENQFQEDEKQLYDLVLEKYKEHSCVVTPEREKSIHIDTRSIIMVYRERKGIVTTHINESRHIFITFNNAIANASKNYESNRSINSGHIPACVSADFFGTILWLNNPISLMGYQKKKLLADCYCILRPSRKLIGDFVKSLEDARRGEEISEEKFLLLRSHSVVFNSLMNITHGDYARFNSQTYIEVYDDIVASANKAYHEEAKRHAETKQNLATASTKIASLENENQQDKKEINRLTTEINAQKNKIRVIKIKIAYYILGFLFVTIPSGLLAACAEIIKSTHATFNLRDFCIIYLVLFVISTATSFIKHARSFIWKIASWIIKKIDKN